MVASAPCGQSGGGGSGAFGARCGGNKRLARRLPKGGGLPDPAVVAVVELDVEPGAAALEQSELGAAVQRAGKLQGVTGAIAFAHGGFCGHNDAVLGGGVLGVDHPRGAGKEEGGKSSADREPEPGAAAPKAVGESAGPGEPEAGDGEDDLGLQIEIVLPKEQAGHERLLGAGVDLIEALAAGITQIGL